MLGWTLLSLLLVQPKPDGCFEALRASHQASRAAWAPLVQETVRVESSDTFGVICTSDNFGMSSCRDECGWQQTAEWHECQAKQIRQTNDRERAKRERVQKAIEALDLVDKVCGWPNK